jgi:trigger factor
METKIKKLPKGRVELTVELSSSEFDEFIKEAEKELSYEKEIPGFRPGKAPIEIIRSEIGETKIYERAAKLAIEKTYWQAVLEKNLKPIELPKIEILKMARDNPFVYKATFSVLPEVKIGEIKKIKVRRRKPKITEKDVEKLLREIQISRRKEVKVDREIRKGDRLEIDIDMFLNKVPIEGGQGRNVSYLLGESSYLPGLEEKLIGAKPGEIREFSLEYPEDFHDKRLAGRKVDFRVKINSVYEIELPNLDDNFAQSVGNFKTLEELKEQLKRNLEDEGKIKEEERLELEILDKLINISSFEEIPEILLENEKEKMISELEESLNELNLRFEDYLLHLKKTKEDLKNDLSPQAEKRIKTILIIKKLAEENNLFVKEDELEKEINELLDYYKYDLETQREIRTDEYRQFLKNMMLNRKVINWLKNQVTIEEE